MTPDRPSSNYLFTLWYRPARTVRLLLAGGRGHSAAVVVAVLFGLIQSLRIYLQVDTVSVMVLLLGSFAGLLGLYLFAWLCRNFSRWFGAEVQVRDVRIALGLGLLPWACLFLTLVLCLRTAADASQFASLYPVFFAGFVYGYTILLLSLSAALRISPLKTFLCLVLTCVVSLFPLTFLAQVLIGVPA